ncbi:hypothetical protein BB559_001294 [Furculomyces boomerangus]|uniref:Uncharacterized protein n=1 Tax=Furculomyces boomerangus TaxID=61424 RepID=A0A2T9Z2F4_9FUNG|nr:hypothetical protein BB559_001294 [Furculomyces boomerangus]
MKSVALLLAYVLVSVQGLQFHVYGKTNCVGTKHHVLPKPNKCERLSVFKSARFGIAGNFKIYTSNNCTGTPVILDLSKKNRNTCFSPHSNVSYKSVFYTPQIKK